MEFSTEESLTVSKRAQIATNQAMAAIANATLSSKALEAKLQRLKQQFQDCENELRAARTAEETAYMIYAQTVSKEFTEAFLLALPRELRDHVYTYLWDDEDIIRQTKRSVREYAWSYRMPEFCAPPYVHPDHVGCIVAEELALSIYKRAFGTKLTVTVSAGHIHKFLAANPLRSNLKPADCIRALNIEWYPNEYSDKDVARSYRDLAMYNFPHPIPVRLILGKFASAMDGNTIQSVTLASQLRIFKPAYDALVGRNCPVVIESLAGHEAEVEFLRDSDTVP
ncbi:hypothetical protein SVAN01_08947 [Stagonosporopsis vannaccii]|nr:hypothetical protein SVAN01_08947 [Stagonosporopsis vannaccii]